MSTIVATNGNAKYNFNRIIDDIKVIDNGSNNFFEKEVVVELKGMPLALATFFPDNSGKLAMLATMDAGTVADDYEKKLVQHVLHHNFNEYTWTEGRVPFSGKIGFSENVQHYSPQIVIETIKETPRYFIDFHTGQKKATYRNVMIEECDSYEFTFYEEREGADIVAQINSEFYC
jgi:hypothetical protein